VPAGRADAKSAGAGTGPAATAATAAATATSTAATLTASLTASLTSLLHKNCHLESSLALLFKIDLTHKLHSQITPDPPLEKGGIIRTF
jgi:hypothetical protein